MDTFPVQQGAGLLLWRHPGPCSIDRMLCLAHLLTCRDTPCGDLGCKDGLAYGQDAFLDEEGGQAAGGFAGDLSSVSLQAHAGPALGGTQDAHEVGCSSSISQLCRS